MRQLKIKLDEIEFTIPALNIAQLETVADILSNGDARHGGFEVLKLALTRATPQPEYDTFAPTLDEIGEGVKQILTMSGLQKPDANPPQLELVAGPSS